jgi:catechol 2,3-dioxygenase-like lactoylglutathione lyase family enzyme
MPVTLDHTIVLARDKTESAAFLAEILGLRTPVPAGHFLMVSLDNGLSLDFCSTEETFRPQHYAFQVSEAEFDSILSRVKERSLSYWADPRQTRPGEVDQRGDGRAFYFADPSGHWLEVLTRS